MIKKRLIVWKIKIINKIRNKIILIETYFKIYLIQRKILKMRLIFLGLILIVCNPNSKVITQNCKTKTKTLF